MVVTRTKSRITAQDGVIIPRGRGQENSTEILSSKPKPPRKQIALRPLELVLPTKNEHIERPIDIKKDLVSDTNELDVAPRRSSGKHKEDPSLHKLDVPILFLSSPLRLRFKGKRRRTRRLKLWTPGTLLMVRASHNLPRTNTKEVQHMLRLRIPVLPSDSDWSQVECLQYLNWEMNLKFPLDSLKPSDLHRANVDRLTEVVQIESNDQSAEPEIILKQSLGEDMEKERFRTRDRLMHGSFQIVTNWTPIQDIEPLESLGVREGTVDSSPAAEETQRSENSGGFQRATEADAFQNFPPLLPDPDPVYSPTRHRERPRSPPGQLGEGELPRPIENPRTNGSSRRASSLAESPQANAASDSDSATSVTTDSPEPPPYEETATTFRPTEHLRLALIHDWEMLVVMDPSPFDWTFVKPHNLPFRVNSRHQKPFPPNSPSSISDINSSGATARFMTLYGSDMPNNQELGFGRAIGRLFADLVSSETITASCLLRKDTLSVWRASVEPVILDVGCVPAQAALDWDERVAPLLFAAQFSEDVDGRDRKASRQLASGLHSTMIILILYYLDVCSRVEAEGRKLPSWMFIYGIVYTKSGFSIHEHYPVFRPSETGAGGWWGASSSWAVEFQDVFDSPSPYRSQSMAALLRICGHTEFVLKKLADWDGYKRAIQSPFLR